MTKVVTYVFDQMFQSKSKSDISLKEKILVVSITLVIVSTAVLLVF
ncbi:hypothetical protein K6119_15365 [Paracrocinitomix mangrovi]|nr:hypothetical protein [Paracrocinitomix mangrovi]UKN01107.1 hypothetical protein K6119_15365 [Paracrocinitomix mangrovi]